MWIILGVVALAFLTFYVGNVWGYNAGYEDGWNDVRLELEEEDEHN